MLKQFIHAAASEPLQIDTHIMKAGSLEMLDDILPQRRGGQSGYVINGYFDPGDIVMIANPESSKFLTPQKRFTRLDLVEPFNGDRRPIGEAARQAGKRLPVPGRQAKVAAEGADLSLGKACFLKRAPDLQLFKRCAAGPVLVEIIQIAAIDYLG